MDGSRESGFGDSGASGRIAEPKLRLIVAEPRDIERRGGIDRTLAVGALLLTKFFGGDPHAWRDRRKNKQNSIRRLADQEDCPFCRSALSEAVAVYVAWLELPCVQTFSHIQAGHIAAVLRLSPGERRELLELAERDYLSVREVRNRAILLRRASGETRGRRARDLARTLSQLRMGALHVRREAEQLDRRDPNARRALGRIAELTDELIGLVSDVPEAASRPER